MLSRNLIIQIKKDKKVKFKLIKPQRLFWLPSYPKPFLAPNTPFPQLCKSGGQKFNFCRMAFISVTAIIPIRGVGPDELCFRPIINIYTVYWFFTKKLALG